MGMPPSALRICSRASFVLMPWRSAMLCVWRFAVSVSIAAGATLLTRMPLGPTSLASPLL